MKKYFVLLALAIFCCGQGAFAQGEDPSGPQTIRNDFLGLQLSVPSGWYATQPAGQSSDDRLLLASSDARDDQAIFMVWRMPGLGRTLQSFATTTENYIFTKMNGFVDDEQHMKVDGAESYLMVYQGDSREKENGWRQFYRVITEKDGDFLIFQGVTDKDDFAKHRGSLENMIKSVTWITPESDEDGK